jgi:hypothetical protein
MKRTVTDEVNSSPPFVFLSVHNPKSSRVSPHVTYEADEMSANKASGRNVKMLGG